MPKGWWPSIHNDTACVVLYALSANQAMRSPIWAHLAFRAPRLGLEDSWPPCTETHWPEIWLEGQRPSYTTSFAAPGPNPPICSLFSQSHPGFFFPSSSLNNSPILRIQWDPQQFANSENSMGPSRLWYILSTYFLVYNHSYVILIQVPLILQTVFHWPLWISHSSRNISRICFLLLAG